MASVILEGLNKAQLRAVEHIDGPILIIAGPGSGKTRVIAHRIAYLVSVVGIAPRRIAALTFTNKAAREMRYRLVPLLGTQTESLTTGTFHSLCASILRQDGHRIGLASSFSIYDDEDQIKLLKRAMQEGSIDAERYPPRAILSAISGAKSQLLTSQEYPQTVGTYYGEIIARAYEHYQAHLNQAIAVDFDDLLLYTYTLLSQNSEVAASYQSRYMHLMIDEFQDTNTAQYAIARLLISRHRNLCVVGDPDQAIYSWRNADIRNILSFQADYPEATRITLEENYRSTRTVLEAARSVIATNLQRLEKNLFTSRPKGRPIVLHEAYNEAEEAQFVAQELQILSEQGHRLTDCAVMYRVNAQSRALEEIFLRYGIPYRLIGGVRFYHRREVKDIIAYLRLAYNPTDEVSLVRVINNPPRGIGQRTLDELTRWSRIHNTTMLDAIKAVSHSPEDTDGDVPQLGARPANAVSSFSSILESIVQDAIEMNVPRLVDAILQRSGYRNHLLAEGDQGRDKLDNVLELRTASNEYLDLEPQEGLAAFLDGVTLVSDVDALPEERTDAVTLITLHQAKGLEFPVVFMVGLEDGLLPHSRSMQDPAQLEEERRLCYVGMTRAQDLLYMLRAFRRTFQGTSNVASPSRFLNDLPQALVESRSTTSRRQDSRGPLTRISPYLKPYSDLPNVSFFTPDRESFKVGDKVVHPHFGKGIIISSTLSGEDDELTVAFTGGAGVKRLLMPYARLEHQKIDDE